MSCVLLELDITRPVCLNKYGCLLWNITNGDHNDRIMNDLCVEKMLSAGSQNNDQTKRMTT